MEEGKETVLNAKEIKDYSPYDYPPDLRIAQLHFENNQFGPADPDLTEEERKLRTCPYSNEGPKKLYKPTTKLEDLTSNGLETMLYFKNLRFILIFIGLYAATQLLPYIRLVRLYYQVNCVENKNCSYFHMIYQVTNNMKFLSNAPPVPLVREEYAQLMTQGWIYFNIAIPVIWVVFFWMRYDVEMATLIFKRKRRPRVSDYTIMIGNVDQDISDEALVGGLNLAMGKYGLGQPQVLQITRGRFLDQYDDADRQYNEAQNKLDEFNKGKELNYDKLDEKMRKKFDEIEQKLQNNYQKMLAKKTSMESKTRKQPRLTRRVNAVAFITIKSAEQAELLIRYESYQGFCQQICLYCRLIGRFFNCGRKQMKILPAPPGKNILWSHVGFCTFNRYMRYFYIIAFCMPIFIILFVLVLWIFTFMKTRFKAGGGLVLKVIFGYLIPYIVIKISHSLTDKALLKLSMFGKGITISNHRNILMQFNYTFRYSACWWALHIKYALRLMGVGVNKNGTSGGFDDVDAFFSTQVFFYVICDVGYGAVKKIIDLPLIINKLKIMWFEIQHEKNKDKGGAGKTQKDVNQVYSKPKFDLMDQYIEMMFLSYFVYKFSIYCPLTIFIAFAYLVIKYWRDKTNLVRHRKPADETEHVFSDFAWNFTFPVGIYACSSIYAANAASFALNEAPLTSFVLMILGFVYPIIFLFNFFIQSWVVRLAHKNFDRRMQREVVGEPGQGGLGKANVSLDLGETLEEEEVDREGGAEKDKEGVYKRRPEFGSIEQMEKGLECGGYATCLKHYMDGGWFDI